MDWAELQDWPEYTKLLFGLFALTEPVGASFVYLGVAGQLEAAQRRLIPTVACATYAGILLAFTFFGDAILGFFGITVHAFRVAGGLLLLLIALDMMRKPAETPGRESEPDPAQPAGLTVAIVPLAVPLLAGPGAISATIVYSNLHASLSHQLLVGAVVLSVALLTWLVFRFAPAVESLVGPTGLHVFHRIMGLIVAAVGVEFMLDGVAGHFPDLFGFDGH